MKLFGIDISRWQGNFNFEAAIKEGIKFAIIKGGGGDDGLYVDSKFKRNYDEAKNKKLPIGVYWFSKALSINEAIKEADYFYDNILKDRQFELPIYIDVENKSQLSVGKRALTDIIKAWCERIENRGYWVGIYSSASYFSSYMYDDELQKFAHWVAQWSSRCNYTKSCLGMWQFGGETNCIRTNKVAGVVCDQNYMLVDYPTKIKSAGLNGFSKATKPSVPTKRSVDELAKEVIAGKWGNGVERKSRLTAAGYDYKAVQTRVNELCATPKKSVDELAKEVIAGKWGNGTERKSRLTAAGYDYKAVQTRVNELMK